MMMLTLILPLPPPLLPPPLPLPRTLPPPLPLLLPPPQPRQGLGRRHPPRLRGNPGRRVSCPGARRTTWAAWL